MATIKLKNGSGAPLASDLVQGEPALDLTNKRLYTEDAGGAIIEVGTNPSSITTSSADIDGGSIDGTVIGGVTPAAVTTSSLVATTADIDAGSIDGTVIGGTTPAAGSFTTFTSTGIDDNATSTAITIDGSQNVGIGASSPDSKLQIKGTANSSQLILGGTDNRGLKVSTTNVGGQNDSGVIFDAQDTEGGGALSTLIFSTGGAEHMRIDGSGNVGIGVADGDVTNDGSAARTYVGIIGTANRGRLNIGTTASNGADAATLAFTNGANTLADIIVDTTSGVQNSGNLSISSTDYLRVLTSGSERMRVEASGNVGIGTSSPNALLSLSSGSGTKATIETTRNFTVNRNFQIAVDEHAEGALTITPSTTLGGSTYTTPIITATAVGNVGIGTSSPVSSLDLSGGADGTIGVLTLAQGNATTKVAKIYGTSTNTNEKGIKFNTQYYGDVDAMTISPEGNVGIGASSPTAKLSLQTATGANNTSYNIIDATTDNPTYKAQINLVREDSSGRLGWAFLTNNVGSPVEAMRIDASGDLLVGKTSPSFDTVGAEMRADGRIIAVRNGDPMYVTRNGSDGNLINFRKDGATVGSIGSALGDSSVSTLFIADGGNVGLRFDQASTDDIQPCTTTGANRDAAINLGAAGNRFKDLWLSNDLKLSNGSYVEFGDSGTSIYGSNSLDVLLFTTSGSESMRIDASGSLLVGTPSVVDTNCTGIHSKADASTKWPQAMQGVDRGMVAYTTATSGSVLFHYFIYNGSVVGSISSTGSSTSYNTSSDYRLKENVVPLTGAIDRVKQLKPSRFNFITDADTTVDGFIAHEVQEVIPEAATGSKDAMRDEEYEVTPAVYEDVVIPAVLDEEGNEVEAERTEQQLVTEAVMGTRSVPDYQGIDQSKLVPLLVAALQEQNDLIDDLRARVAQLESN